ncbi:MAG: hypothetical protein HZB43_00795 [candidate division Zixibacteria bacterium]|nr:hypothetical protein [candidate division Zixibacteria bacterium]
MTSIFDIEQEAQRLERRLEMGIPPEVQLVLGLKFFELLRGASGSCAPDSYLIQFLPRLAAAASKADPEWFFPEEVSDLLGFAEWVRKVEGDAHSFSLATITQLGGASQKTLDESMRADVMSSGLLSPARVAADGSDSIVLNCLFVEHFPDLDLPPRGRLLKLQVTATSISRKIAAGDLVVRNPVTKPDDRFLAQARDSVHAARAYMERRYGLSLAKRYRFDFAVDTAGARFTGDSLGVAFAAGAIASLARIEVLRERLSILSDVAFSGALQPNGVLSPIDDEALKRKIDRAFFSRLKYLVIPRENIKDAWTYLREVESHHPDRKLELVGADTLDSVAADPRLIQGERFSSIGSAARRVWRAKRAPAVEVSALLAAALLLLYLILPARYMPWFDRNPALGNFNLASNSLDVRNRDSVLIWSEPFPSTLATGDWRQLICVHDLDGDGKNEVLVIPHTTEASPQRDWLYCFSADCELRFRRYCAVSGQYPGDTSGVLYDPEWINVATVRGNPVIVTEIANNSPARSHIRFWNARGDSLGWYVNAGGSHFILARDLDGDSTEELLFLCYNIRMRGCALIALSLDSASGCSPPYTDPVWDLNGLIRGRQFAYALFLTSDLGKVDLDPWSNQPVGFRESVEGQFDFITGESSKSASAKIIYKLDRGLRVREVRVTDEFVQRRAELLGEGKLPAVDWTQYTRMVFNAVSYWQDTCWVVDGEM